MKIRLVVAELFHAEQMDGRTLRC